MGGAADEPGPGFSTAGPDEVGDPASIGTASATLFAGVRAVCDAVVRLTGADGAAVAVFAPSRTRELVYASDAVAQQVDELQFTLGEGPCLDAYREGLPQLCPRLDAGPQLTRWPGFCSAAGELGARAVFAFPVRAAARSLGVLELYRLTAGELEPEQHDSASVCADTIGETLLSNWGAHVARTVDAVSAGGAESSGANEVLRSDNEFSRAAVYVASGMVAVQLGVSADEGLDWLRAYTFSHGRSITDVAADVVGRRVSLRDYRDRREDGPPR
jgi:hypothetical protein